MERSREASSGPQQGALGPKRNTPTIRLSTFATCGFRQSYGAISKATGLTVSTVRRILGVV